MGNGPDGGVLCHSQLARAWAPLVLGTHKGTPGTPLNPSAFIGGASLWGDCPRLVRPGQVSGLGSLLSLGCSRHGLCSGAPWR